MPLRAATHAPELHSHSRRGLRDTRRQASFNYGRCHHDAELRLQGAPSVSPEQASSTSQTWYDDAFGSESPARFDLDADLEGLRCGRHGLGQGLTAARHGASVMLRMPILVRAFLRLRSCALLAMKPCPSHLSARRSQGDLRIDLGPAEFDRGTGTGGPQCCRQVAVAFKLKSWATQCGARNT
eukprot:1376627-Rhodomonas_salina.2